MRMTGVTLAALGACVFAGAGLAATPQEQQFVLAGQRAAKITVAKAGWHRVSRAELAKAGISLATASSKLQLYAAGKQVPIRSTRTGIEFYGVPLDTISVDTTAYWLVAGTKPGLRVRVNAGRGGLGAFAPSYPAVALVQPREVYVASIHNGETSNVFGPAVRNGADTPVKVTATRADLSRPATVAVAVQGFSLLPHKTRVRVNGTDVGAVDYTGQARAVKTFAIPAGTLKEGENVVGLQSIAGELDISVVDSVQISYERGLVADADLLDFVLRSGQRARIDGFTRASVRVVDVTNPDAPVVLSAPKAIRAGTGYRVVVGSARGDRHLIALVEGKQLKPKAVVRNRPSRLNAGGQGADLVIISHRSLMPSLTPLVETRQREGLKVIVADVEDVYDEFGYGAHGPQPLKDFLAWARAHWAPAPRFALLVGDATHDPRDQLGKGDFDLVPTKIVETIYLETASDDWFADFDNDGVPELAVGRLPVRTLEQANGVVAKLVSYGSAPANPSPRMVLVSDSFKDYDFEAASRTLHGLVPANWVRESVNRREGPSDAAVRSRLVNSLNQGPTVVNFFGHGSIQLWTAGRILSNTEALALRNTRYSLYVMMTCLNGFFTDTEYLSLGEVLLSNPAGGAVAVWSSTGETVLAGQVSMDQRALGLLFANPQLRLGEAMIQAKAAINDLDVRRTWVLFGDPTTRLR